MKTFTLNGYPKYFPNTCIRCFLDKIFCPDPKVPLEPIKVIFFSFPLTGQSLLIRNQVRKLCYVAFPHISICFLLRMSLRFSHFFPLKNRVPKGLRSRVVYRFKCQCCSTLYIGQTSQHLHTRLSDYLWTSIQTGKKGCQPFNNQHSNTSPPHLSPYFTRWFHCPFFFFLLFLQLWPSHKGKRTY